MARLRRLFALWQRFVRREASFLVPALAPPRVSVLDATDNVTVTRTDSAGGLPCEFVLHVSRRIGHFVYKASHVPEALAMPSPLLLRSWACLTQNVCRSVPLLTICLRTKLSAAVCSRTLLLKPSFGVNLTPKPRSSICQSPNQRLCDLRMGWRRPKVSSETPIGERPCHFFPHWQRSMSFAGGT